MFSAGRVIKAEKETIDQIAFPKENEVGLVFFACTDDCKHMRYGSFHLTTCIRQEITPVWYFQFFFLVCQHVKKHSLENKTECYHRLANLRFLICSFWNVFIEVNRS